MKRKTVCLLLALLMLSGLLPTGVMAAQNTAGWDGVTYTEPAVNTDGAYIIGSPQELMWFNKNAAMSDSATLTADITINPDLSADEGTLYKWTPIGISSAKFMGSFDGNGHTVSGLYVNLAANGAGFIGYAGKTAEISNLTVSGKIIGSKNYTGGIVGDCAGAVTNCHNLSTISGNAYVGGVVGDLESGGTMEGCSNRAAVTAASATAGGVVGRIDSGSGSAVQNCFNAGSVQGTSKVGGVVGDQYAYGSAVTNVYNTGNLTATTGYAGGILGNFRSGTLKNAYMSCKVSAGADNKRGKIAGTLESASQQKTLSGVYYQADPAFEPVANLNGCTIQNGSAIGQTDVELKALAPILGDGFAADSQNANGGYPILKWQTGNISTPDGPASDPGGWDGKTVTEPTQTNGIYQIGSAPKLAWFAAALKKDPSLSAALTADVDLNNRPWTPMCGTEESTAYSGSFDGGGHTIKNLYISGSKPVALFAGNAGTVKNLTAAGLINGADYTAAIVAYNYGAVENCRSEATVTGGNYTGGITAKNTGAVTGCTNLGSIIAAKYAGGVAAFNGSTGTLSRCCNTGAVECSADFSGGVCAANEGAVKDSFNTGLVVGKAALLRSYVGGVVGWNNGTATNLYNTGSVISSGCYTGGAVGISTTGTTAENLYGVGSVMGMYQNDSDGNTQFYVGGAVGRKTDQVKNAYYLDTLAVTSGGTAKSEAQFKASDFPPQLGAAFTADTAGINGGYPILTWQTAENAPSVFPSISGSVTVSGDLKSGATLTATYTGNAPSPLFVWYTQASDGEYVHAIGTDTYTVPVNQVGATLGVKVFSGAHSGFVSAAASGPIEGMNGTVTLTGAAVVGKTLTAGYSNPDDEPHFQWYRGTTPISGAIGSTYIVQGADAGYTITVRVTGSKAGYVEKSTPSKVVTAESAGVWPDSVCDEPANVGGVYVITTQRELYWFASEVNCGSTSLKARLANDIALTETGWYPIGTNSAAYAGVFDGNGKTVTDFKLNSSGKGEQGFFGKIAGNGQVKNLSVSGSVLAAGDAAISIGGIAGCVEGSIEGCTFSGSVAGQSQVGGIAGLIGLHGRVAECANLSSVTGAEQLGGIAGASSYGDTYYCVNRGSVGSSDAKNVGGIVGDTQNYAVITGCYNTGAVQGLQYVGGISGKVYVASAPLGCYNVGTVTGGIYTGGAVGSMGGTDFIPTVKGSFYLDTLPQDTVATAKSDSEMKQASFVSALNSDAFIQCYVADNGTNGGFPILKWERDGHTGSGGGSTEPPSQAPITVTFTLLGDTAHGDSQHTGGTVTWLSQTTVSNLPATTTAYDLFRTMLTKNGYTYEAQGSSYIAYITSPQGLRLGEFTNGPYSGWMYTINGAFPDYMSATTLKDGDSMVFFYTDDYRKTGWNPNGKPGQSTSDGSQDSPDASLPFTDVAKTSWYYTAVKYAFENNLFNGITDNQFSPDSPLSRAMAVAVLHRMDGSPALAGDPNFDDVAQDKYYAHAVIWAGEKQIINGVSATAFDPDGFVTREQMAVMLYRYAKQKNYDTSKYAALSKFADSPAVSSWAKSAMEWAVGSGLIVGVTENTLSPTGKLTRAQAAAMLMRFGELAAK